MLRQKTKKSLMAFKKSLNRRFDPGCQVKFRGIIGRNLKKSTLFSGSDLHNGRSNTAVPRRRADRSLTNSSVSVFMDVAIGRRTYIIPFWICFEFRASNFEFGSGLSVLGEMP